VIGQCDLILDESYLVSTESRGYINEPEAPPFHPVPPLPSLPRQPSPNTQLQPPSDQLSLPVQHRDSISPVPVNFPKPSNPHTGRHQLMVKMGHDGVQIRDLVHPSMTEPLRNYQHSTFKLIKLVSDFNHQLSKIHEQHAEDLAQLVKNFRKKTTDIQNDGPRCNNTIGLAWEQWMGDVMQDSACHTEMSSVLDRAVARPLLEKTFHMKIQSRKVFAQRESFERLLSESEDQLAKSHGDFRISWSRHVEQQGPTSLAKYLESHNAYVGEIYNVNGMVDQYYVENLPHLLQELDDVYHDVSEVVLESLTEGAKKITEKTLNMNNRWMKTADDVRKISAEKDISAFLSCLTVPDFVPVTKHKFSPPPPKEVTNEGKKPSIKFKEIGLPIKTCDLVLDRVVSETARNRHEQLRTETKTLETDIKLLSEAVESLIRIQAKNLDQQLFNKANEIQEEISRKRFDLQCAQIKLAGMRAQKELFAAKATNENESKGAVEGVPAGGPRERKLSTTSTVNMKSKWVNAFKNIKGKQENGNKPHSTASSGPPPILENSHVFQEYTYKKITPCDVCSQILRGHTRQGLKCKLCRMNIHPDCQDKVVKCQPKSKLLKRQKSASDVDPRMDPTEDDSGFTVMSSVENVYRTVSVDGSNNALNPDSPPGELSVTSSRKKPGGSYSRYTASGQSSSGLTLLTEGDLVDSSGRKIKTASNGGPGGSRGASVGPQSSRHP